MNTKKDGQDDHSKRPSLELIIVNCDCFNLIFTKQVFFSQDLLEIIVIIQGR